MPALRNRSDVGTGYQMLNYYVGGESTDGERGFPVSLVPGFQISRWEGGTQEKELKRKDCLGFRYFDLEALGRYLNDAVQLDM